MSRTLKRSLLFSLLVFFPLLSSAQLVRYEYWFDSDYAGRTPVTLNGSETLVDASVPTDGLEPGIHSLHFRLKRQDGWYSPVTTSLFFKAATSESGKIEYWFDDDFENRTTASLANAVENDLASMSLDLRDHDKFPMGAHRLHIRLLTDLGPTAIYTSDVLKLVLGSVEKLQYWFDDNIEGAKTTSGVDSQNGIVFTGDLDLSGVPEGMHRLYYRGISSNKQTSTAVAVTPVMVKSRYGNIDAKDLKIVQYAITVDDNQPVAIDILNPQTEITQPYTLNAQQLSDGKHTVTAHYWNSAGVGVAVTQEFKKENPGDGSATLTATEQDGLVTINLTTAPNGIRYQIYRGDANGAKKKIYSEKVSYPNVITVEDTPRAGSYTYYAVYSYEGVTGDVTAKESNQVSVTIANAKEDTSSGVIIGELKYPGVDRSIKYSYSDGTKQKVRTVSVDDYTNMFQIKDVPFGATVTIVDGNEFSDLQAYTFDKQTATVDEKHKTAYVTIEGILKDGHQPSNMGYDLKFASTVECMPRQYVRFKVKSIVPHTWKGAVRVLAVKKSFAEKVNLTDGQNVAFSDAENYHTTYSEVLTVEPGQTVEVTIPWRGFVDPHISFLNTSDMEEYLFYYESVASGQNLVKRISPSFDGLQDNPQDVAILKTKGGQLSAAEETELMANMTITLLSALKAADGKLGNTQKLLKTVNNIAEARNIPGIIDLSDVSEEELINYIEQNNAPYGFDPGGTLVVFSSLVNEAVSQLSSEGSTLIGNVRDKLKPAIKKYKTMQEYWNQAKSFVDALNTYKKWDTMTPSEQFFYGARAVLLLLNKVEEFGGNPVLPIIEKYIDIAEITIEKGLAVAGKINDLEIAKQLMDNRKMAEPTAFRHNTHVDVMVYVDRPVGIGNISMTNYINFTNDWALAQIDSVYIVANNGDLNNNHGREYELRAKYDIVGKEKCFLLTPSADRPRGNLQTGKALNQLLMEVHWHNGRVSMIPLIEDNGIKREIGRVAEYTRYKVFLKTGSAATSMADKLYLMDSGEKIDDPDPDND